MTRDVEDRFQLRPRPPRSRGGPRAQRFLSRVQLELTNARGWGDGTGRGSRGTGSRAGRGFAAARLVDGSLGPRARRVVIKTRLVVLKKVAAGSLSAHLRYITRDGVGRDGQPLAYGAATDAADLQAFQDRAADDRHQFRFIVAPEDASELADLRGYTRHLMAKVESDLGARLEWIAVDHWDTDNPHTHIVLRGKDGGGRDLVIAGDYIAHGMRARASEIATAWLGPRTDLEIQLNLEQQVSQERWTGLDRELCARSHEGRIDLTVDAGGHSALKNRTLLLGRLHHLQALGLARVDEQGAWALREDAEDVLRRLGERGDIIRTMQRAFGKSQRELVVFDPATAAQPIVGGIVDKGLVDELGDRAYIVVDAIDGRGHYVTLPDQAQATELPLGAIVDVRPMTQRAVDRNILTASRNGVYETNAHLAGLLAGRRNRLDAEQIVASHVRRLEALRRSRIVERMGDGVWRVPPDLVERGAELDRRRLGGTRVELLCHLPIERQIRAIGATWLDQRLVEGTTPTAVSGFAVSVRDALKTRQEFLLEKGFVQLCRSRVVFPRNLIVTLRAREVGAAGQAISAKTGLSYRPMSDGSSASGVYRRSVQLVSGCFAMLDNGLGFSLVPWRPILEKRLGQSLSATVHDGHVDWQLGRGRGPAVA
jgi:type IV secretory pathway VirD2 relaxase